MEAAPLVSASAPSESTSRTGPQPLRDGPGARALAAGEPDPQAFRESRATRPGIERALPVGEPYPEAQPSPGTTATPIPTSNRLPTPPFPGSRENAGKPFASHLPDHDQGHDQPQRRGLEPPRETRAGETPKPPVRNQPEAMTLAEAPVTVRAATTQVADRPAAGPVPGRPVPFPSSPITRTVGSRGGETAPAKALLVTRSSSQPTVDQPAAEMAPETRVTGDASRALIPSAPGPFASGAHEHGSERMEASRARPDAQAVPDEIRIHIGRIEVIAVSPPPVTPAAPKPPRRAPSLDEYLRRRDGRAQ